MICVLKIASSALLGLLDLALACQSYCRPNTWLNLSPIPVPRQEHPTVALNKATTVVIGGVSIEGTSASSTDLVQFDDIRAGHLAVLAMLIKVQAKPGSY